MKIGIIGSEATRGIFLFNSIGTTLYKTDILSYQTTCISNVKPPIKKGIDLTSLSAWDRKMIENNLYKVWMQRLKDFSPSVVIFDFVSDVMYSSIPYAGSEITKNPIILKHFKNDLADQASIHLNEETFFSSWLAAAELLIKTAKEICPKALIVLHSAQLLNTYVDKEGIPRKVRNNDYETKNGLLARINIEAERLADITIKSDPLKFHGQELHPWGIGVAKYETKYNTHMLGVLANKLLEHKFGEIE
ncbi:DUF6270 domain-containing protein [Pseudomonas sp. Irchel s3h17]|uniref:DUF6270 domain-containing protein n=1 Tax=Pseudomonas sp. Irchel s3h17 TaxID=2009182 RepID=UPI000BA441A1|nr:DUF6270 domain-containing protein [Pseudomonas sp. Irchel s3h17]